MEFGVTEEPTCNTFAILKSASLFWSKLSMVDWKSAAGMGSTTLHGSSSSSSSSSNTVNLWVCMVQVVDG
jgi:hypothetical protein